MKNKFFKLLVITICISEFSFTQDISKVENLFPTQAINRKEMIVPVMNSMIRVELRSGMIESTACQLESIAQNGLKIDISWYNNNDETGKMMLGLVSNQSDIEKQSVSYKKQMDELYDNWKNLGDESSCSGVKEESVPGGKLYIMNIVSAFCDTEGRTTNFTNAKSYFSNGNIIGNIEISCFCKSDEVREMIISTIKNINDFNFSSLLE